jgi:hypothetical protein
MISELTQKSNIRRLTVSQLGQTGVPEALGLLLACCFLHWFFLPLKSLTPHRHKLAFHYLP